MKTIALYVVVGLCRIIFITADEQGDGECNHITYVQILPTYAVVFFFLQLQMLIEVHWVFSYLDFYQRVVVMIMTVSTMMIHLKRYAKVCMPSL